MYVARIGEDRNKYAVLVEKPGDKGRAWKNRG